MDEETGLYYYGARYLDPKYSRWLSGDPALGEYMSGSSVGEGGIYNTVNFNVYHYGNNNPIKYTDPTGMWIDNGDGTYTAEKGDTLWDKYGADWKEKSGFDRDPRTLQSGETVGQPNSQIVNDSQSPSINENNLNQQSLPSMYEDNQSVSDVKNYKLGVSLKGALVIGLGIEAGVIVDSTGSFGLYGTGYWGTGVQIGVGNSNAKGIKGLFDLLFGGGIGTAPGDIASAQGLGHSADGGALVLGTWDLNAPNKSGAPNSLSGIGVGGVWWSATGVWKIYKGKK